MTIAHRENPSLEAGETVPTSGIYRVTHIHHRLPHNVLAICGEELPPCRWCRGHVRFKIVQAVSHMTADWDLAGVSERVLNDLLGASNRRVA